MAKSLKCLTCGGELKFNPTTQNLKCEWCDTEFTEAEIGNVDNLDEAVDDTITSVESMSNDEIKVYRCKYCGAEVVTDNVTAASFCVYCQRPIVMEGQLSGGNKPSVVIPFKNTKDQALKTFKEYIKGKRFLPNEYVDNQNIEKLTGVYIPFWLYNGDVGFNVQGEADIITTRRSGDYSIKKIDTYRIAREGEIHIDNIPVDASSRTPDDVMDSIEPFDFAALTGFSTNYLSGFLAERYDEDEQKSYDRARVRFEGTAENKIKSSLTKYTTVRRSVDKKRVDNVSSRYGLLPVWMLFSEFQSKKYIFAMNGQTGKLTGDLPVDSKKVTAYFFKMFLMIGAVAAILGAVLSGAFEYSAGFGVFLGIMIGLVIGGLVTFGEWKKHRPIAKSTNADYYVKEGDAKMRVSEDSFIRTREEKTKVATSNNKR